jgi:CPA1 family monovalent cation:H+ antiporter
MRVWHFAVLLAAGIGVGIAMPGRLTGVFGAATLYAFLPALIFEAAWNLDFPLMRRAWKPIALLAVPGVLVTAGVVTVLVHAFGGFGWAPALLLGSILSATDPVAVVALFRRLPVPRALATIVESESLLNDAIAVVVYRAILSAIVVSAGSAGIAQSAGFAVSGVIGGIAIGLALAYVAAYALRDAVTTPVQCAATLAGAYGAYFLAERFEFSGIFSVIAFGIALRELERRRISVASAEGVAHFWDIAAITANVALFFLIGAALDLTRLLNALPAAGITIGAVVFARFLLAYGLLAPVRRHLKPFWQTVVRMAGIRGALSLALALATPAAVSQRGAIIDATFAVVVVTIFAGSLTLRRRLAQLPLEVSNP